MQVAKQVVGQLFRGTNEAIHLKPMQCKEQFPEQE